MATVAMPSRPITTQGSPLKNERERMDIISAYREVGSYRGAAAMCGTTHKTVRRVIEAHQAGSRGEPAALRVERGRNYDSVAQLVAEKVNATAAKISAKRLLPAARAAGYEGSDRNFRRLVADAKRQWRIGQARAAGRRPAIWTPGEVLAIDWGTELVAGRRTHVFCAVLAWSRYRFVRFAPDEQQATTLGLLAECFEELGGVPTLVLADRMACLKGNVVANVVVPAPDYVRFASHYRFRPDFCHAADPESKGIVENLVGYAKDDLLTPLELEEDPWAGGYAGLNERARAWGVEVNGRRHSEIHAVPLDRLGTERDLLGDLPSLRLEVGPTPITRKVDKLSCIRFGSARYSVPNALIGRVVTVLVDERDRILRVIEPVTGQIHAEHGLVAPGEVSIDDAHYDRPRPASPNRAAWPHAGRAGIPRVGSGRRAVPGRCRRRGCDQAGHRDRRGSHPGRRARHRAADRGTRAGRRVRQVARRRRPVDPGHQRPRTPAHASRAGAGNDPSHRPDQVAGRLPDRWDRWG